MAIINATVIVDGDGLTAEYPNGTPLYGGSDLGNFYSVSVPSAYNGGPHTIECKVNDVIRFRALPMSNAARFILIDLFADEMTAGGSPTNYVGDVAFISAAASPRLQYSSPTETPSPGNWPWGGTAGWTVYQGQTGTETASKDSFLQINALQPTGSNEVRYTLGFKIYHGGAWHRYYLDPLIKIDSNL